jgi:glutathione S-transferase
MTKPENAHLEKEYFDDKLHRYFKALEKRLDDNISEKYIVGSTITIADFDNAAFAYTNIFNEKASLGEKH